MQETSTKEYASHSWYLNKSIGIEHLFTTLLLLTVVLGSWYDNNERVAILDYQFSEINNRVIRLLERQANIDDTQNRQLNVFRDEMRNETESIDTKIDTLIEFHLKQTEKNP